VNVSLEFVHLCEVGPRDGLQNETRTLPPGVRAELVNRLAGCGLKEIEAISLVRDDWVPAMAGAEEVMAGIDRIPGLTYSALILNEKGYERARRVGADQIHFTFACTDAFARANQNSTAASGLDLSGELVTRARSDSLPISVTLSVAFGCPFEGPVAPAAVLSLADRVARDPPDRIVLADTIGVAVPSAVRDLVGHLVDFGVPVGVHLHDTRGMAVANACAALEAGATSLDCSIGGAGGCPFAPGATGNVATEDLVYLLDGMGVETGVDLDQLIATSSWLEVQLGHRLPSRVARAALATRGRN